MHGSRFCKEENGPTVGPVDDLFKLGGDSLSTIMLIFVLT